VSAITVGHTERTGTAEVFLGFSATPTQATIIGGVTVPGPFFFGPFLTTQDVSLDDQEDLDLRSYVSRLWAEDWDSPEDSVYDQ
jgi:hypothetical protein